jgi:UDP-N-acetylmuramoyl-L-alanine---L-glutamate ligase
VRLSALEGRRVALWGLGREGRAAWRAIRARFPDLPLTVFCPPAEHGEAAALGDALLVLRGEPSGDDLAAFEVVVKSPGISAYHPAALVAAAQGAAITSGTALWFGEGLPGLKVCVTGTKGKSSTTALIAHLLRARGLAVGLAGNIGLPLLELIDPPLPPAVWAIELSSYQTGDAERPDVAVVLNLSPEHLDWHGSAEQYFADKLALVSQSGPGTVVLNWEDVRLREVGLTGDASTGVGGGDEAAGDKAGGPRPALRVRWFGREDGWHLRDGDVYRGERRVLAADDVPLPGEHNRRNLCAALTAIEALGFASLPLAPLVAGFRGLPHRLQSLGVVDGIEYVDDSISTTPLASIAALECFAGREVAILLGGYERGLPWDGFADYLARHPARLVICRGQNGPRIAALLRERLPQLALVEEPDLAVAVTLARNTLGAGGVLLLSPGAPSFPEFRDYADRGRRFAEACGFDGLATMSIPGLGIG